MKSELEIRKEDNDFIIKDGKLLNYVGTKTEVKIPEGVISIGDKAFTECDFIEKIEIPNTVTNIGHLAFNGCEKIKSIEIPDSVTSIGIMAFESCKSLENVKLPKELEKLELEIFNHCMKLKELKIPKGIKNIKENFSNIPNFESINVDAENKNFSSIDGVLYDKKQEKIILYPKGKESEKYTIPNTVKEIGQKAFEGCQNLKNVIIPDSVIKIDKYAFFACKKLENIKIPKTVKEIGKCVLANCQSLKEVDLNAKINVLPRATFAYCPQIKEIKLPPSVKEVKELVFKDCFNLEKIITSNNTKFDEHTFGENTFINNVKTEIIEETAENKTHILYDLDELLESVKKESKEDITEKSIDGIEKNIDNNEVEL